MDTIFPWSTQAISREKNLAPDLLDQLAKFYDRLKATINDEQIKALDDFFAQHPDALCEFHFVVSTSAFAYEQFIRQPGFVIDLLHAVRIKNIDHINALSQIDCDSEAEFNKRLRIYRVKTMLRIIWRDFNRLSDFNETTDELSALAKAALNASLQYHYASLSEKYGTPRCANGKRQPLIIIGMGKLGASELNLSSDIDLIFAYPEKGQTDSQTSSLSNQEFFIRLGKKVIQSLDAKTAEGFVFRVDMRLRPYGQSGALVYSFDALLEYYQTQGREWERYAMVKASVVANNGEKHHTKNLESMLRDFTYRRYVDFSVIDALRSLKKTITQEVKRRRLEDDIKLGPGGIREIEFIAQVFQLIRGGRDKELRDNRLLKVLSLLAELNSLPKDTVKQLTEAYLFLRDCEHAIQGFNDQQTQKLPTHEIEQNALTAVMAFDSWSAFTDTLDQHRNTVKTIFNDIIADPTEQESSEENTHIWLALWQNSVDAETAMTELRDAGHETPELSLMLINELREWVTQSAMHATSRERVDAFLPLLLLKLADLSTPTEILRRMTPLIKSIARRSAYLLLLIENPTALTRLLQLSAASPWIAEKMATLPALLDELLDPDSLFKPPEKAELESELRRILLRIPESDLEAQMDTMRYFRSSHTLRVACSEVTNALPLMRVSDYLTAIAEVIIDFVLRVSWNAMVEKHGYPDGDVREHPNFAVVGYGKLGGIELGHGSDLDLVFLHGASISGTTSGPRSIDNQMFYTRLGQKIIHFLTTNMASGALYEVDMRLRPSGNSGMLVTSIESFEKYQAQSAWTWEHQALVRARCICGDQDLAERFSQIRFQVLAKKRDLGGLRDDVIAMREKMRMHLGSGNKGDTFYLKHDAGGIVDIEFMVQYSALAWTHSHPGLAKFTDNIRILESLETSDLLDTHEVCQLIDAYKAFRSAGHRLTLQQQSSIVSAETLVSERRTVINIWQKLMGEKDRPST